jgi:hypothetical protein
LPLGFGTGRDFGGTSFAGFSGVDSGEDRRVPREVVLTSGIGITQLEFSDDRAMEGRAPANRRPA